MATFKTTILDTSVEVTTTGFRGGHFTGFYVERYHGHAPGWFIHGRNPAYGGRYTMLVARPDVKPRKHPHFNCVVRRGWHRKQDAQAIANVLNARDRDSLGMVATLGELHGAVFRE